MKRLLITGAAGAIGRRARTDLAGLAETLRLSDVAEMDPAGPGEEVVRADLADGRAMRDLLDGVDAVMHLGAVSTEGSFELVCDANIRGVYNLYEAALAHDRPRILLASSVHAIGFHEVSTRLDAGSVPIADGLYGASKVWGEQIALVYWHKFGIESARVRIGSCFPAPRDVRMLSTWLSYADLFRLAERVFAVRRLGCPVIYGASDNAAGWWDNRDAGYLGWQPQDSADGWRESLERDAPPADPDAPEVRYQGGSFAADDIHRDPEA